MIYFSSFFSLHSLKIRPLQRYDYFQLKKIFRIYFFRLQTTLPAVRLLFSLLLPARLLHLSACVRKGRRDRNRRAGHAGTDLSTELSTWLINLFTTRFKTKKAGRPSACWGCPFQSSFAIATFPDACKNKKVRSGHHQPCLRLVSGRFHKLRQPAQADPEGKNKGSPFYKKRVCLNSLSRPVEYFLKYINYPLYSSETVNFFLPCARREANTRRPLAVAILERNPCLFFLFLLEG